VIQDDCHALGILHHGYKVLFQMYELLASYEADDAMIECLKANASDRLKWLYNFIKRETDPEFDLANKDFIRSLVSRIWSDEFDRIED
jgi:hypothetical protein